MSATESIADLRKNLIGDIDVHGRPWMHRSTVTPVTDDETSPLYPGAVPVAHIRELFARYEVGSFPLMFQLPDGTIVTDDTRQVIADNSTNLVHGVFASGYEIHPFGSTLIDGLAHIVGDSPGDVHFDSAGILANGAEGWVSLSTSGLLSTPEGVDYWPHILAASSHNGTLSSTFKAVCQMVVCDNTRDMALGEKTPQFKIKHTRYSARKLNDARDALGLLANVSDNFAAEVKVLCEQTVTDSQWSAYISELAPITDDMTANKITRAENFRAAVTQLYKSDVRAATWYGTAFGALQAVNTYSLWERKNMRGDATPQERMTRDALTGALGKREQEAANTLGLILVSA